MLDDRSGGNGTAATQVSYSQSARPLEVITDLGRDALLLAGISGQEAISQLFEFRLDLLAENRRNVPFEKLLGKPVGVRIALPGGDSRCLHGIARRLSQGSRDHTFTRYQAEVVPSLWLLTRRVQSRIFQHESVPDILKQVLAGLDVHFRIQGKFEPRDYCTQYRESDFDFASRLMEEEGLYYYFQHSANGHLMVVANAPTGHADLPSRNRIVYDETGSGVRDESRISIWQKTQELRAGKVALWDYHFELPGRNLEAEKKTPQTVQVGTVPHNLQVEGNQGLEIFDFPGGYAGRFDGIDRGGGERPKELEKIYEDNRRTAEIRMQQEALPGLVIQGNSDCRQLTAGHKFTLERHFNADGPYVLTSVEHHAETSGDFRSGRQVEVRYQNRFTCIPLAMPFRPQRTTPRSRVEGPQTAVVVGPEGEEIFCDKYGRVKVRFRWDRDHQRGPGDRSCWIRVATPWAGKKWGLVHVPRIGHEVLVAFEEGDPDQPIIIGSVYNADHMPPHDLPKTRMISGLRTNSTPGGGGYNGLLFDDTKGKEKITTHGQFDMDTTVEHDQTTTVHNNRTDQIDMDDSETVGQKQTIEVGADQKLTVGGMQTIDVTGDIKITSASTITLGVADSLIKISSEGIEITSPGTIKIASVGQVLINGATVEVNC